MPTYKQNPNPTDTFDLTVEIANAPGPFKVVTGSVQYDITNMDCLPPANFFSGVQTTPISTFLPIHLEKVGETTFRGRVALDALADEDYFGHGTCRFKAIGPSIELRATGSDGETRFFASMDADSMTGTTEKTSYYWQGSYPRDEKIENYPDNGAPSPDRYVERLRSELFSIRVTAARSTQP